MKKKLLVATAACALSAATAVPALALENEFHGMFRVFGYVNNFGTASSSNGATSGNIISPNLSDNSPTRSYIEQRARLMYIAKANDDLKLVTHFEIDSRWGDNGYTNGRNIGGAIGADTVNIETKNVYLDFNIPSTAINVKVGEQPWVDSYGGIFVNADMSGALVSAKYAGFNNSLGWFRFNEELGSLPGKATRDFLALDSKYNLSKDIKVGGSYYLLTDDRSTSDNTYTHMVGLNGEFKLDPVTLGAFGMYQFGDTPGVMDSDLSAFAAGATLKAKAGIGTAKLAVLYTSGDKTTGANTDSSAFQVVAPESNFYVADMQLLLRNKYNINSDRAIVHNLGGAAANEGFVGGFVGYDANITPKFFANVNAGFAAAANTEGDNYLGTELNAEVGYKLFDNMTASVQGAYFVLGDYFDDKIDDNLDDPYQARIMLNYAF